MAMPIRALTSFVAVVRQHALAALADRLSSACGLPNDALAAALKLTLLKRDDCEVPVLDFMFICLSTDIRHSLSHGHQPLLEHTVIIASTANQCHNHS